MSLRQAARRIKLIFGNDVSRFEKSEDASVTRTQSRSIWNGEDVEVRASKVARGREIQARN